MPNHLSIVKPPHPHRRRLRQEEAAGNKQNGPATERERRAGAAGARHAQRGPWGGGEAGRARWRWRWRRRRWPRWGGRRRRRRTAGRRRPGRWRRWPRWWWWRRRGRRRREGGAQEHRGAGGGCPARHLAAVGDAEPRGERRCSPCCIGGRWRGEWWRWRWRWVGAAADADRRGEAAVHGEQHGERAGREEDGAAAAAGDGRDAAEGGAAHARAAHHLQPPQPGEDAEARAAQPR